VTFAVGLDLGSQADFSALTVVEHRSGGLHVLRYARRIPLGTPFAGVTEYTRQLLSHPELGGAVLGFDQTGLGLPVAEMLRGALGGSSVVGVVLTGGDQARIEGVTHYVPKSVIVANTVVMAETGRLRIAARMQGRDILVRELAAFKLRVSKAGNELFDAERGSHDDLVLSLAIATWIALRAQGANWIEFIRGYFPSGDPDEPLADVVPILRPKASVPIDYDVRTGRPFRRIEESS
jgi:hypothetical protein